MAEEIIRKIFVFEGHVQGVGFRYRAQYAARALGLTGWVMNNDDGTVTMEAQGPRTKVNAVVETLINGSRYIMIEHFSAKQLPVAEGERSFRVRGY